MASGLAIQKKIAKALGKLQATSRLVQFRTATSSGGNALLGVGRTTTVLETPIDPQPAVSMVKPQDIAAADGRLLQLGDYRFVFAGTIPETMFQTSEILYGSDVLKIVTYEPVAMFGTIVAWDVIARSAKVS